MRGFGLSFSIFFVDYNISMKDFFDKFEPFSQDGIEGLVLPLKAYPKADKALLISYFKTDFLPSIKDSGSHNKGFNEALEYILKNIENLEYIIVDKTNNCIILATNKHQLKVDYPESWKIDNNLI